MAGFIGAGYLTLVGKTSFIHACDHPKYLEYRRLKKPLIYAFWHNAQVFLVYMHRNEGINAIVSRSGDGEYITQVMKRMGINAVRGSTSRGGEQALRDLCELLEGGKQAGFTPDGPRGPAQTVQGGVVMAAQRSGAPIVPMTYVSRRRIIFDSWDKFVMPLPFSTIIAAHSQPIHLPADMPLEEAKERVRKALNDNVDAAQEALHNAPWWGMSLVAAALDCVYTMLVLLLSPFSLPFIMARYGAGRTFRFLAERFHVGMMRAPTKKRVWIHAASVGEWQALKPVLNSLEATPNLEFVITVSTPEARVLVSKERPDIPVRMMPFDLPFIMSRWVSHVLPWAAIVVETELWPHMISTLHRRHVPVFIINGRLSARSLSRWRMVKPFIQIFLLRLSGVFARTDLDGTRYCRLGVPRSRIVVTGNTKYDGLTLGDDKTRLSRRREVFGDETGVWVIAGSTWPGEEASVLKLFDLKKTIRYRLILAPRHKSRFAALEKLLACVPASWSSWSKVKETHLWDTDILLVDTLGDLKNLYLFADIAFVGGSLTIRGGQNPLEPAAAGLPVLFGPSMENFHEETAALKRVGAARQARHEQDVLSDIQELASDESLMRTMGGAARRFIEEKQGAAARTTAGLKELLGL